MRSGKYVKAAEAQAGEFAGKVISNLLLLGHARVSDLVQAYRGNQSDSTHGRLALTPGAPSKFLSNSFSHAEGSAEEQNATYERIYETLRDLLRTEFVSRVHISHFRSDTDNRSEAENVVPKAEEYKAKSKREQDAQHEVAVKRKLKEWKYCTHGGDDEVDCHRKGKKRPYKDPDSQQPEKRQRTYHPSSQEATRAMGEVHQPLLERIGDLDVRNNNTFKKGTRRLTLRRAISSFGSIMPSLPS